DDEDAGARQGCQRAVANSTDERGPFGAVERVAAGRRGQDLAAGLVTACVTLDFATLIEHRDLSHFHDRRRDRPPPDEERAVLESLERYLALVGARRDVARQGDVPVVDGAEV